MLIPLLLDLQPSSFSPLARGEDFMKKRLKRERREREQLREMIEQALEVSAGELAHVVPVGNAVAVLPNVSKPVRIALPPLFDITELVNEVISVIKSNRARPQVVQTSDAVSFAERVLNRRRRRDEEFLMLL